MIHRFRARIRESLADVNLQSALDANAEKRLQVRKTAFESLDDPQGQRRRAHQVRAEVIEHLDEYLAQFIAHASKNGFVIHQAKDDQEALKIILELALQHRAKLVAKSKTMVSEEIGLNHALEMQNIQVIETDLGEYIVQLRGEPPSHIITPAVHLRRHEVGRLFEEKLNLPYTDDISVMTNAARRTLRQVFLDADIGFSGVNFGVAETGTLCVVTNEGNGRMVTTVPRVHIALMGIERLVPSMDDLALMLSLLPRSATGQKLSVYTSLLNAPRRPGDPDGPEVRHIILVDHGRSSIRNSELSEILYCIRCGACLNACPVFREIGGHAYIGADGRISPYSGPMGSVVSPAMFGQLEFGHLARASSLCAACHEACPVDIDLPKLLLRVRAGMGPGAAGQKEKPNAPTPLALGLKIYTLFASSPWRFGLAQNLAGLFGGVAKLFGRQDGWIHLPAFSGWGYSKDFPSPAAKSFRSRFKTHQPEIDDRAMAKAGLKEAPPDLEKTGGHTPGVELDPVIRFESELAALGGNFIFCQPGDEPGKILEILQQHHASELLTWEADWLPEKLLDELSTAGIHIVHPRAEIIPDSSRVKVGLTGAQAGIAESGSLLILGGSGKPLTASLLPEVHIALLRQKDIYLRLDQVLGMDELKQSSAACLVTGPSRTADIEMTLTIGVHGPGELDVICLLDETATQRFPD